MIGKAAGAAILGGFLAAGCTIVQVDRGRVASVHGGILRIEPAANAAMAVYHIRGVGLVPGHGGVTLGVRTEIVAALRDPSACRIILVEPDRAAIQAMQDSLAAAGRPTRDICSTGEN